MSNQEQASNEFLTEGEKHSTIIKIYKTISTYSALQEILTRDNVASALTDLDKLPVSSEVKTQVTNAISPPPPPPQQEREPFVSTGMFGHGLYGPGMDRPPSATSSTQRRLRRFTAKAKQQEISVFGQTNFFGSHSTPSNEEEIDVIYEKYESKKRKLEQIIEVIEVIEEPAKFPKKPFYDIVAKMQE